MEYDEGERRKRSRTVFGFMALNGNDVVMVSETAKATDMTSFLELVRRDGRTLGGCPSYQSWTTPGFTEQD
jgi:hypothetical protein